jgi:hypothetical protein
MGITKTDADLIDLAIRYRPDIKTVCELGSQNLYRPGDNTEKPPFANILYNELGISGYDCIDMAGDNGAIQKDLSHPINLDWRADLVTDFGTSEHVVQADSIRTVAFHEGHINSIYPNKKPTDEQIRRGYYECWRNKHNLLNLGGVMISVNPKTGNWPEHGYTYVTKEFYLQLAMMVGYDLVWLAELPAMGNQNAVNIECVLFKKSDAFCSFDEFQNCEQFFS